MNTPSTGASIGLATSTRDGSVPRRADAAENESGGLAVREADLRTSIRPTVAEVDLGALCRNVAQVRAIVGGDESITIDELAAWANTISYEILCGISKRVPRIYRTSLPGVRS